MKRTMSLMAATAAAALLLAGCGSDSASDFPIRDVNVTVPFNPGGSTDLTARILAEAMSDDLDVEIVVTNTPGAGGSVGTQSVLNAKNDGYSILADGMLAFTSMPVMDTLQTMPADWDFWLATYTPNIVAVPANSPYQTMDDLLDDLAARPGEVSFGSAGPGSGGHLGAEIVAGAAGATYRHVPYEGGNPAIVAALGGEVDAVAQLLVEMKDMLIAGELRGLASLSVEDIELDGGIVIPSISQFLPELESTLPMGETTGLAVPKGLDEQILSRIDTAFDAAMADQRFLDFCEEKGMDPVAVGRADAAGYVDNLQSIVAWTLQDAGVAVKSPDELEIPRP